MSVPPSESVRTHYRTCPLCEATCGLAVEVEGDRVTKVRGDDQDPFSRGFICPKGANLGALHHDPDRLRTPLVRLTANPERGVLRVLADEPNISYDVRDAEGQLHMGTGPALA